MPDPDSGGAREIRPRTTSPGGLCSRVLRLLTDRRHGFQALLWAAGVNLLLFGILLASTTPVYETNDDLMMQLIASGFHTGHPDAHLVFTNILIGGLLQFLYETCGGINWYFGYLVTTHYASLTAIAFLVISRRGGWRFALLYTGLFLLIETHLLLYLQFTTTAFLAGVAGLLLLVDGLRLGHPAHWAKVIAGIALVGLMCLIRETVAPLLAIIACPFVLERFGLAGWRRLLGAGLACIAVFLLLREVDRHAYQRDPAWAEFSAYNRMRGQIHVTPLAKFVPQAAPAAGWSENDGAMFAQFYFSEPSVYAGAPKMRRFLDKLQSLARTEPAPSWNLTARSMYLPNLFWNDARVLMRLALLTAVWCVFAAGEFRRRCLATLLVSYALYVALSLYLTATARLPERITYNIPLFIEVICLYWATAFANSPAAAARPARLQKFIVPLRRAGILRLTAVAAFSIWIFYSLLNLFALGQSLWETNADNRNLEQISRKILTPIRSLLPEPATPVLIPLPFDSVLEQCTFFYGPGEKLPFFLVPYGWITHSPIFNQTLDRHQLRPYSLSLVDRRDVFFLMEKRWLEPLTTFYREHYRREIRFDMVLNTDGMAGLEDCHLHLYQAHAAGNEAAGTPPASPANSTAALPPSMASH